MKIASWNVNSIRTRLQLTKLFLEEVRPDVVALQETRCSDTQFPFDDFAAAGYEAVHSGAGGHGGVALLSAVGLDRVTYGFSGEHGPPFDESRLVAADVGGVRVMNIYAPNGRTIRSAAWEFKLAWFELLRVELELELGETNDVLIVGDFNVCPRPEDVYDPVKKRNRNLVSKPERQAVQRIIDLGFHDLGRSLHPDDADFTWFSHAAGQFEKNRGYRLDLVLASKTLAGSAIECEPLLEWRDPKRSAAGFAPSDHAPLVAVLRTP